MASPLSSLTLTQIRYFARTAELGSMSGTAAEMYVAQSAVSTSIAHLEASLGTQLFIRQRSRGVVLTEAGHTFYRSAQTILNAVDDAVDSLQPDRLTGTLTAGCFTTLAPFWLPEVHERLVSAYPDLEVRLREVDAEQIEPILRRHDMEVVLTYGFDYGRTVDFEVLQEAPIYAAVAEDSHLAGRGSVTLEELAEEPLILLDIGKSTNYFLSVFHNANLRPRVQERFESFEVVRSMAARGHGYTILNQRPAHDLSNDGRRLVTIPIDGARSNLQVGVAHRADEELSQKGLAFLEQCREIFGA